MNLENIKNIIKNKTVGYVVFAIGLTIVTLSAAYFSNGTLLKGALNPPGTPPGLPQPQPIPPPPGQANPTIHCVHPATAFTGETVTWLATASGPFPGNGPDVQIYQWVGDVGIGKVSPNYAKTFQTSYPAGTTSATLQLGVYSGTNQETTYSNDDCTITLTDPPPVVQPPPPAEATVTCNASPATVETGDTVTWTATVQNSPTAQEYFWTGDVIAQGTFSQSGVTTHTSVYNSSGQKNAHILVYTEGLSLEDDCSVQVNASASPAASPPTPPPTPTPSPIPKKNPPPPPPPSSPLTPKPAQELVTCTMKSKNLILSINGSVTVNCDLDKQALVRAFIVEGTFDPLGEINEDEITRETIEESTKKAKPFLTTWNGIDRYDKDVTPGEYSFVIAAHLAGYLPDYSIHTFTVFDDPPQYEKDKETVATQETVTQETITPLNPTDSLKDAALHPAAIEAEPSKCPGINYPTDVPSDHWAYAVIRSGYDSCLFKGYANGTFQPDKGITRAEALKITLAAANIPPKTGCYDADCGSPFMDLDSWQGQWVRTAWDTKVVKGYTASIFGPNRSITRAEATAMIARAFGIPAHQGCYTANCGAGHPDNFFLDIQDAWQGAYIRALWDIGLLKGKGENTFAPNANITRAELAKLAIKAKEVKN